MIKKLLILNVLFCSLWFPSNAQTWNQINEKAWKLSAVNLDSAIYYGKIGVITAENQFGKTDQKYVESIGDLAYFYYKANKFSQAKDQYLIYCKLYRNLNKIETINFAINLKILAEIYISEGAYDYAEPLCLESSQIHKRLVKTPSSEYLESLYLLTRIYKAQRKYEMTLSVSIELLKLTRDVHGAESSQYEFVLQNLANVYRDFQSYPPGAEQTLLELVDVKKKIFGANNIEYGVAKYRLALMYLTQADYLKAEVLLLEVEAFYKTIGSTETLFNAYLMAKLSSLYKEKGDFSKTVYYLEEAIRINKINAKEDPLTYGISLNNLATTYANQNDYQKAEPLYLAALQFYQTNSLGSSAECARTMDGLGTVYKEFGNFEKAVFYYQSALALRRKILGPYDEELIESLSGLGILYQAANDSDKAEALFLEAAKLLKDNGISGAVYAGVLTELAAAYSSKRLYQKAESAYLEAISIYKNSNGGATLGYARLLNDLSALYIAQADYSKAQPLLIEVVKIGKIISPESKNYAAYLSNLGVLYQNMGNFSAAEPLLAEALLVMKTVEGIKSVGYARSMINIAMLYNQMGDFQRAEANDLAALDILSTNVGFSNADYITALNNTADLYQTMGNSSKAIELFNAAVALIEKKGPEHKFDQVNVWSNLASLYMSTGEHEKAEILFLDVLAAQKKQVGILHPDYSTTLNNLAVLYGRVRDFKKSEAYYLEAMNIIAKVSGKESSFYAKYLHNLAGSYMSAHNYTAALSLGEEGLQIYKNKLGDNHPEFAQYLIDMAGLYDITGDLTKSESYYLKGKEIILNNIKKYFSFLSESEKEKYARNVIQSLEKCKSFFSDYVAKNPVIAIAAYDTELAEKGMILSSSIQMRQAIIKGRDQSLIALYEKWLDLKAMLAKSINLPPASQVNLGSVEANINSIEKQLIQGSSLFSKSTKLTATAWSDVQDALKSGEVAIEFSSFRYHNGSVWTDTVQYVALLLRKEDKYPKIIKLCLGSSLDSLFKNSNVASGTSGLYRGAKVINQQAAANGKKLSALIWQPLQSYLADVKQIYFSPSGLLNQVAFAAITESDGVTLSARYRLRQLSSTAILTQPEYTVNTSDLKVEAFGGVKYESETTKMSVVRKDNYLLPSFKAVIRGEGWDYLPGTLTEIENIAKLGGAYKIPVTIYKGTLALEENYKQYRLAISPKIIHISTHGFFFPNPSATNGINTFNDQRLPFQSSSNPLNRAGLLFAGANSIWKGQAQIGKEDGILTAFEASLIPISNTALVVLSACETGLGEIKGSEGVFGLQRAFKSAGAEYLMMSLWKVPDLETSEFMTEFYNSLFSGISIEGSFDKTQRMMRLKYVNEPYKWAAFVLVR